MRPLRYSINVTLDPYVAGYGPTLFAGLGERLDLHLVQRHDRRPGALALRYEPA